VVNYFMNSPALHVETMTDVENTAEWIVDVTTEVGVLPYCGQIISCPEQAALVCSFTAPFLTDTSSVNATTTINPPPRGHFSP
jgi:hypothetical protein